MPYPRVYSHPRSGTNFLCAQLKVSFYPDDAGTEYPGETFWSGHWSEPRQVPPRPGWAFQQHGPHQIYHGQTGFFIYRDGRDVLVSLWESKTFQPPEHRALSFSAFIRQPLDWRCSPRRWFDSGMTPVEHWHWFVSAWLHQPAVHYIRYADLLHHREATLDRIGEIIGRAPQTYDAVAETGPDTHGGGAGKWLSVFSKDDLAYFYSMVPTDFEALWRPACQ